MIPEWLQGWGRQCCSVYAYGFDENGHGASRPQPIQIKTGISDGVVTEVLEGLKEGDRVVTAELSATPTASAPAANPFSGGRRFP